MSEPKEEAPKIIGDKPKRFDPKPEEKKRVEEFLNQNNLTEPMTVSDRMRYTAYFMEKGSEEVKQKLEELYFWSRKLDSQNKIISQKGLGSKAFSFLVTDPDYAEQAKCADQVENYKRQVLKEFQNSVLQKSFLNEIRRNKALKMAEDELSGVTGYAVIKINHKDKWSDVLNSLQNLIYEDLKFQAERSQIGGKGSQHIEGYGDKQAKIIEKLEKLVQTEPEIQKILIEAMKEERIRSLNLDILGDTEPDFLIRFKTELESHLIKKIALEKQRELIGESVSINEAIGREETEIVLKITAARKRIALNERLEEQWQTLIKGYSEDVLSNQSLIDLKRGFKDALENEDAGQIENIKRHIGDHLDHIREFNHIKEQIQIIPESVRTRLRLDDSVLVYQDSIERELTAKLNNTNIDAAKKDTNEALSNLRNMAIDWGEAEESVDKEIEKRVKDNFPEVGGDLESEFGPLLRERLVSPVMIRDAKERARTEAIKEVSKSFTSDDRTKFQEFIFTDTLIKRNVSSLPSQGLRAIWKGLGIDETSKSEGVVTRAVSTAIEQYQSQDKLMNKSKQLVYENLANLWINTQFGVHWLSDDSFEKAKNNYIKILKLQNKKVSEAELANQVKQIENQKNALRDSIYYSVLIDPSQRKPEYQIKPEFIDRQSELIAKVKIEFAKIKSSLTEQYELLPETMREKYERDLRQLLAHQKSLELEGRPREDVELQDVNKKLMALQVGIRFEIAVKVADINHEKQFSKLYQNIPDGLKTELQQMRYLYYTTFFAGADNASVEFRKAMAQDTAGFEAALIRHMPQNYWDEIRMKSEIRKEMESLPAFKTRPRPYTKDFSDAKDKLTSDAYECVRRWRQNEELLIYTKQKLTEKAVAKNADLKEDYERRRKALEAEQTKLQTTLSEIYKMGFSRDLGSEMERYSISEPGIMAQAGQAAMVGVKAVGSTVVEFGSRVIGGKVTVADGLIVAGAAVGGVALVGYIPGAALVASTGAGAAAIGAVKLVFGLGAAYWAWKNKEAIKKQGGRALRLVGGTYDIITAPFYALRDEFRDIRADYRIGNKTSAFMRSVALGLGSLGTVALFTVPPTGPILWGGAAATLGVGLAGAGVVYVVTGIGALASKGVRGVANFLKLREKFKKINKDTKEVFGKDKAEKIYEYLRREYSFANELLNTLQKEKTDKMDPDKLAKHKSQIVSLENYCNEIASTWRTINSVKKDDKDDASKKAAIEEWKVCSKMIFKFKQELYVEATKHSAEDLSKSFLARMRKTFVEKPAPKPLSATTPGDLGVKQPKPSVEAVTFGFGKKAQSEPLVKDKKPKAVLEGQKPAKQEKQSSLTTLFSRDRTRKPKEMEKVEKQIDELGDMDKLLKDTLSAPEKSQKPQNQG